MIARDGRDCELTQAEAAVVGRHLLMTVYAESHLPQTAADLARQQRVHEDATTQDNRLESGRPSKPVTHNGDEFGHRRMKPPGDAFACGSVANIVSDGANDWPGIDDHCRLRWVDLGRL